MIAPIKEDRHSRSHRLRRARGFVASKFLGVRSYPADNGPTVSPWKAWLFTAWVVSVTAACLWWMVQLF